MSPPLGVYFCHRDRISLEMNVMIAREVVEKRCKAEDVAQECSYFVDSVRRWTQQYRGNPYSPNSRNIFCAVRYRLREGCRWRIQRYAVHTFLYGDMRDQRLTSPLRFGK